MPTKKMTLTGDNKAFLVPIGRALIILFVIACISIFILTWLSVNSQVKCDISDRVTLKGTLLGFTKNDSFWNVKIDNETYLFDRFDSGYMMSMIGYNVTINTCWRHDTTFTIQHYDFVDCFINEVG